MSLQTVVDAYRTLLTPIASLESVTGARISPLDVAGALRLALIMRQLKDMNYGAVPAGKKPEPHSFVKDLGVSIVGQVSAPHLRGGARADMVLLEMLYLHSRQPRLLRH